MAQHNISINGSTGSDFRLFFMELMEFLSKQQYAEFVFIHVLAVIVIPVMILTLIALCFIIKSRPAASVFVSHLILSDRIQVICLLIKTTNSWTQKLYGAYHYSLIVGLYFMACVAFEQHLLVSHPIWYKSHQSHKLSCFISVIIWFVPLIFAEIKPPHIISLCTAFLIPYPILILCFAGTCRGLSHSISLTSLQRKLILGSLFLVLLTYTFLILPFLIMKFIIIFFDYYSFVIMKSYFYAEMLLYVNPFADCLLYLFIRPDVGDMMKSLRCCCRHNQDEHSVVNPQNCCSQSLPPRNVAELRGSPSLRRSLEQLDQPSSASVSLQGTDLVAPITPEISLKRLIPLVDYLAAWKLLPSVSQWVLHTVEKGYRIHLGTPLPRFSGVIPKQALVMEQEVDTLLRKEAIEVVPPHERESGFYSRYFIVPKKDGGLRPILDLHQLNYSVMRLKFKMLTIRQVMFQIIHNPQNPQNCCSTVVCCISAQKPASHSLNTCSSV